MSEEEVKIIVMKSNNEQMADTMSKSGFDFKTAMYELVDNSMSAGADNIVIAFYTNPEGHRKLHEIHIRDNGKGFNFNDLTDAFAMGVKKGTGSNEHGVGFKNAIAFYGSSSIRDGLIGIETFDGIDSYEVVGYEINNLLVKDLPVPDDTGTCIKIDCTPLDITLAQRLSPLVEALGVRYANYIDSTGSITIKEIDVTTGLPIKDLEGDDIIQSVPSYLPPYYNPVTKTDIHFVKETFSTPTVTCELTLGLSRSDLATGPWKRRSYGGGIDVVQNNRVLMHRDWLPLEGWRINNHTSINPLIGQLVVTQGHLPTTPKKDSVQRTPALVEVQEEIAKIIRSCGILSQFGEIIDESNKYSEPDMRDALAKYLRSQKLPNGDRIWGVVKTEESTDTNLSMDVTAVTAEPDNKLYVFEVKKGNFNAQDMNQLIGYMVTTDSIQGIVLAKSILSNAKKQFDVHWKPILDEYNIQYWDANTIQYKSIFDSYMG